jgi:hypothetical protein
LDLLSAAGWSALWDHGVRTIIDLRNDDERGSDRAPRPAGLTTVNLPLDVSENRDFWNVWASGPQFGTPLYYLPHLERFPERSVAVLQTIAHAAPGGVLFHCGSGRDRVGQVAMLVLHLLDVPPETVAADYELSAARLPRRFEALGQPDQGPEIAAYLAERGTNAGEVIVEMLAASDVRRMLERAGLKDGDLEALRARALDPLS